MGNYFGPYSSVLLVFVCWVRGISGVGPSVGFSLRVRGVFSGVRFEGGWGGGQCCRRVVILQQRCGGRVQGSGYRI